MGSTLVFVFEDKEQNTAAAEANALTRAQKSEDYYSEKARKESEQLLEARKSQKDGRWADPNLRRLLLEYMHYGAETIRRDSFYKWIISNKDEDGDNLFDDIYAEKNEYCIHNSGYFMYKTRDNESHNIKFTECIALKEISTGYLPLYAKCDIEVRTDFQVRFYQDDKYIAAKQLVFK